MPVMTGFSGNEMYCLHKKGMAPGDLVIGNSVYSLGIIGGIGAGLKTLAGGEVEQITHLIHDGRKAALDRMIAWSDLKGAIGITGVTSELVVHSGNIEFLSIGSAVHRENHNATSLEFTSCADGQELYCQIDSGFKPVHFVFGNVAYSIGIGGGIGGALRSLGRGEVKEYSEVFNVTRHLALQRIQHEARTVGANAVVGINTSIFPFGGMQEMIMIGTASRHDKLGPEFDQAPITSDLTNEEMWNLMHIGYMPLQLVLGVSVYSLGLVGGITAAFKSLGRGEIEELTKLIYDARENALHHIMRDATACGADDVVGIKTYVYELGGGMIEFMAIGTAVKKMPGLTTLSDSLPPQAVIRDKDTFINAAEKSIGRNLNEPSGAR
ncbi:MAG: heavy metal-binding domain-containing protein [Armatimonadetes bacterium]|nr:heavy metal-binding domain-containing protein [Armatimonadota bacterium]